MLWADRWARFTRFDPFPEQVRLIADGHRNRTCVKGRRAGGSTVGGFELQVEMQLWGGGYGEAEIAIVAPNDEKTQILYGMVHDSLMRKNSFGAGNITRAAFRPGDREIKTRWGSVLRAFSLKSESPAEGHGFRFMVVDEAQRLKESVWGASLRPTLSDRGGRGLIVGKAAGGFLAKASGYAAIHPAEWGSHRFPTAANPNIPASEIEQARRELPAWLFAQEYLAEFQAGVDRPFAGFAHLVDLTIKQGEPRDRGKTYVDGWDLARKRDRTVGVTLESSRTPHRLVDWSETFREPWPVVQRRIRDRSNKYGSRVWLDATGVGDGIVGNLDVATSRVVPFIFTPATKINLLTTLQAGLEHGHIALPNVPRLLDQLENYEWDDDDLETDWVMALALAYMGCVKRSVPRVADLSSVVGVIRGDA